MATLTASIGSVRSFSRVAELKANSMHTRASVHCRRRLAYKVSAESGKESDNSAYPQAAAPSSPGLYTGYIKKDSAGIAVIDVVEPAVYVESGSIEPKTDTGLGVLGGALALVGAAFVLSTLGTTPQLDTSLTLSQYVDKFSTEISAAGEIAAPAAVPVEASAVDLVAPALFIEEPAAVSEEEESPVQINAVQVFEVVPVPEPEPSVQAIIAEPEEVETPLELNPFEVFEVVAAPEPEPAVQAIILEEEVEAPLELDPFEVFEIVSVPEPEPAVQAVIELEEVEAPLEIDPFEVFEVVPVPETEPAAVQAESLEAEEVESPVAIAAFEVFEVVPVPEPEAVAQAAVLDLEEAESPVEVDAFQVFEVVPLPMASEEPAAVIASVGEIVAEEQGVEASADLSSE